MLQRILTGVQRAATRGGHVMPKPALRVAFAQGVTVTKWARAWTQRHPERPLELVPTDAAGELSVLRDGRALLSFVRLSAGEAARGGAADVPHLSGLHVIPLYEERPVVVVPKDHVLAAADSVTLSEVDALAGGPVHAFDDGVVDTFALVAAGVGVAIVPHSIARLHARRDVVAREVSDGIPTSIALAWPDDGGADPEADAADADSVAAAIEDFVGIVRGRTANSSRGNGSRGSSTSGGDSRPTRPGAGSRPSSPRSGPARGRGSRHPRKRRP
jgi:LysR substrate binding domain.